MKRLSKWFYLSPGIAYGVFYVAMVSVSFWWMQSLGSFVKSEVDWGILLIMLPISFLAMAIGIWFAAAYFIVLYKAWASIRNGNPRTTPSKAVGFSFIPYFNFYWRFQALWGFAKDYNSYISSLNQDSFRINQRLFLWDCIMPLIYIVVSVVVFSIFSALFVMSALASANNPDYLLGSFQSFSSLMGVMQIPMLVIVIAWLIIELLVLNTTCDAVNNLVSIATNDRQ